MIDFIMVLLFVSILAALGLSFYAINKIMDRIEDLEDEAAALRCALKI